VICEPSFAKKSLHEGPHRQFQGRKVIRALMVTAEGSAERRVAPMCIPRNARKLFSHLDELSLHFRALLSLPCTTGLAIPAMNSHAHNYNAQLNYK